MKFNKNKTSLVLGAPDAITARLSWKAGADYIWASSFVLSNLLGIKDDGMISIKPHLPLIKGLIKASPAPVVLDIDIMGRDMDECYTQLNIVKEMPLAGICIEDEPWPKLNAMLNPPSKKLISIRRMTSKISTAKKVLNSNCLTIARTHSLLVDESYSLLQKRIDDYTKAGADIICIHYIKDHWDFYQKTVSKLNITQPLMVIFSKRNSLPECLDYSKIRFIVFPNQIYRTMLYPISEFCDNKQKEPQDYSINFKEWRMVDVKYLFRLSDEINKK